MPSQNRPVVKDGRLVVKKRTDRSYLKSATPESEAASVESENASTVEAADETAPDAANAATAAFATPHQAAVPAAAPSPSPAPAVAAAAPKSSTARALEQQGVRKRREIDLDAVAQRDSNYAKHELRRIAILTAIVIVVLVVLALTLR